MKTQNSLIFSVVIAVALVSSVIAYSQISLQETQSTSGTINISGFTTFVVYGPNGEVKSFWQSDNLVVNEGLYTASDLFFPDINLNGNATDGEFNVLRIGVGTTGATLSDTGLETPVGGCAPQADPDVVGVTAGGSATITINATFTGASGCVGSFTESVLANSLTGGEILARQTFSARVMTAVDTLVGTWEITVT